MAKLIGALQFVGTIDGITVYKRWDLEKPIVRKTGHPTRKQVKTGENFAPTRRINEELSGRSKCSAYFNKILTPLKPVCGFNYMGSLNKVLVAAQKADKVSEYGKRGVLLSKSRSIVDGYSLNHRNPVETILQTPVSCSFNRGEMSVAVKVPAFVHGSNFRPIGTFPVYRVILTAGIVPDMYFDPVKGWHHKHLFDRIWPVESYGQWRSVYEATAEQEVTLTLDYPLNGDDYTVLVGAGISFGLVKGPENFQEVKGAGCGKVIGVF